MRQKLCWWSFMAGVAISVTLGLIFVLPPAPQGTSSTLEQDCARLAKLVNRLELQLASERSNSAIANGYATPADWWLSHPIGLHTAQVVRHAAPAANRTEPSATIPTPPPGFVLEANILNRIDSPSTAARPKYVAPSRIAENGSSYGQPNANGVPKSVKVEGYFRSDGTYVRGHYRSAPGSNWR
jgi:hypothetical protein